MVQIVGQDLECVRGMARVFEGVTFSASRGECLGVVGANGSGKSSLLRMIAGLIAPSHGELDSVEPEKMHWICPKVPMKSSLSVFENVTFWSKMYGGTKDQIEHAMQAMRLSHLRDRLVSHLSSGQLKRVSLARLFLIDRPVWILDEPENALDQASKAQLAQAMGEHMARGGLVILASHQADLWPVSHRMDMDQFSEMDE